LLAIDQDHLKIRGKTAYRAIMEGYREGIACGGRPFVIGEEHRWFKPILDNPLRDPGLFWDKLRNLPKERAVLPTEAKKVIIDMMPDGDIPFRLHHRVAGLGNLGKPRYTAIAEWHGGPVAREAKALTISAAAWASGNMHGPFYADILGRSIRSADPYLKVYGPWLVRRLSPDCRRLEVASISRVKDEEWLLHAMGFETANVHLGTASAWRSITKHLKDYSKNGIRESAVAMKELLEKDYRRWNG
jgi:hypothetical protein